MTDSLSISPFTISLSYWKRFFYFHIQLLRLIIFKSLFYSLANLFFIILGKGEISLLSVRVSIAFFLLQVFFSPGASSRTDKYYKHSVLSLPPANTDTFLVRQFVTQNARTNIFYWCQKSKNRFYVFSLRWQIRFTIRKSYDKQHLLFRQQTSADKHFLQLVGKSWNQLFCLSVRPKAFQTACSTFCSESPDVVYSNNSDTNRAWSWISSPDMSEVAGNRFVVKIELKKIAFDISPPGNARKSCLLTHQ